jgi:hypothetical protein
MGPRIADQDDGRLCRALASGLDRQRGGMVCQQHVPLEVRAAISQAEAYGSAHVDIAHAGRRYLWQLRWDDNIGRR